MIALLTIITVAAFLFAAMSLVADWIQRRNRTHYRGERWLK